MLVAGLRNADTGSNLVMFELLGRLISLSLSNNPFRQSFLVDQVEEKTTEGFIYIGFFIIFVLKKNLTSSSTN